MKLPWLERGWSVGIDIGATNVKLVCLCKEQDHYRLMAHGFYPRKRLVSFKEIFEVAEMRQGEIRVNIEDPSLKIRKVDLPIVPTEELPEIIKWGLKDVLVDQVDNYLFRHQPLPATTAGGPSAEKQSFLVFALKKTSLESYRSFLQKMGVPAPNVIEPNVSGLFLGFRHCYPLLEGERFALIDMGSTFTHFMVFGREGVLFSRPLGGMAGESLTKQISRNLGVEEERAEQLKIESQNGKLKTTIAHFFSRGVLEIQRSIDAYGTQFPDKPVTKIYFTGGGSKLEGLLPFVESALQIPSAFYQPLQKTDCASFDNKALEDKMVYYGLAFGLALQ